MTLEQAIDLAFFVQDFNTKSLTSDKIYDLYGVTVNDRTDLIDAVERYYNKYITKDGEEV